MDHALGGSNAPRPMGRAEYQHERRLLLEFMTAICEL
jgi:hypothetical protein